MGDPSWWMEFVKEEGVWFAIVAAIGLALDRIVRELYRKFFDDENGIITVKERNAAELAKKREQKHAELVDALIEAVDSFKGSIVSIENQVADLSVKHDTLNELHIRPKRGNSFETESTKRMFHHCSRVLRRNIKQIVSIMHDIGVKDTSAAEALMNELCDCVSETVSKSLSDGVQK